MGKNTQVRRKILKLQVLLIAAGYETIVDGNFCPETASVLRQFQADHGLEANGVAGPDTWWALIERAPEHAKIKYNKLLTEKDLCNIAARFDLEPAVLKAVREVESSGIGFVGKRPKMVFEGHIFWERLKALGLHPETHRVGNENILHPDWSLQFYRSGRAEYERLEAAMKIHETAALESTSWGLFQIMGYQWKALGYASVQEFVRLMHENEACQLKAFCHFLEKEDLIECLRNRDWTDFARRYNGPRFFVNHYDEQLERAYQKHKETSVAA